MKASTRATPKTTTPTDSLETSSGSVAASALARDRYISSDRILVTWFADANGIWISTIGWASDRADAETLARAEQHEHAGCGSRHPISARAVHLRLPVPCGTGAHHAFRPEARDSCSRVRTFHFHVPPHPRPPIRAGYGATVTSNSEERRASELFYEVSGGRSPNLSGRD